MEATAADVEGRIWTYLSYGPFAARADLQAWAEAAAAREDPLFFAIVDEASCDRLNAPSIAAAERLGFTFEGVFRQATIFRGRNRDTAWFAIIDRDWEELRSRYERWLAPDNFDADGVQRESLSTLTAPLVRRRFASW